MRIHLYLPLMLVIMAGACLQAQAMMILRKESAPMRWDRRWCLWGCRYISVTAPLPSATSASELGGEAILSVVDTEPSITFEPTVSSATLASLATSPPASAAVAAEVTSSDFSSALPTSSAVPTTQSSSGSPKLSSCVPYLAALSVLATTILYI
ncbi:hypothetical protein NEOLEDRAFT_802476 [Neolentinus lepideus HHB14362 ss-1]|uniref:Uncharacterized protein n=1 Tax=Neolentinus lepideus HHB14362 ss-1 TaxID=1314782 RepID=A0A165PIH5_9AGAM|nr:hypothetical protein NEOLEDRAFT_802476 [Neolentinus lepideus HHB14362 ss-1]